MRVLYEAPTEDGLDRFVVGDVTELYGKKGNFRVLQFSDEAMQGALDLDDPQRIVFEYPRAIVHLLEHNHQRLEHIFQIGHGIGTIARHFRRARFKTAELDARIVQASEQYFGYDGESIAIGDGRRILEGEEAETYDAIIVDAFTERGVPRHLTTDLFFSSAAGKLEAGGTIVLNVTGKGPNDRLIGALHATLRESFTHVLALMLPADGASETRNILLIGRNRGIDYRARDMAGFVLFEPAPGHVIMEKG
ncbi:fused MFS/spermidine synthase [Paenibacillus glycanilyticus]|uniref:spermidine synthase n=1 Tax=Paenibacillus glycanilyticus TaxID=126569 RepID=UPI00203B7D41|nr:fused MFS/spermidine synthase [Paenibacillus glycanilyticus]MCM3626189.1 fused MFS/spermidine synthase [Paenibacillus glycanilyticus]